MQEEGEMDTTVRDRSRDTAGDVREKHLIIYTDIILWMRCLSFFNEKGLADWNSFFKN